MAQLRDFCGFQWNGVHSSQLNIIRVSDGSRYNDTLLPTFQDTTSKMAGSDGTLYWESFYTNKSWNINIAFDNLSEEGYRALRATYNAKDRGLLIFDETPYKAYTAKIQAPPQLKAICFEENGQRVYKGEGTIQFIAYYPYAKSIKKYLNQYAEADYPNKDEWAAASGLKSKQGNYDTCVVSGTTGTIPIYNGGDIETDWKLYVPITSSGCALNKISIQKDAATPLYEMNFSNISRQSSKDTLIRINSQTNLIEGCNEKKEPTGTLYNQFIISGDFFKIPLGEFSFMVEGFTTNSNISLQYDYLYY